MVIHICIIYIYISYIYVSYMPYVAITTYISILYISSLPKHLRHRGHRGPDAPGPVQGHVRRGLLRGEAVRRHGLQGHKSAEAKRCGNDQIPMEILWKMRTILWKSWKSHENPRKSMKSLWKSYGTLQKSKWTSDFVGVDTCKNRDHGMMGIHCLQTWLEYPLYIEF